MYFTIARTIIFCLSLTVTVVVSGLVFAQGGFGSSYATLARCQNILPKEQVKRPCQNSALHQPY